MTDTEVRAALQAGLLVDASRHGLATLLDRLRAAVTSGVTMVHLRAKHADAREFAEVGRAVCEAVACPVVVHERVDVALACGAAGAHLGPDGLPVLAVRPIVPPGFLLGASLVSLADRHNAMAADYVLVGPHTAPPGARRAGLGDDGVVALAGAVSRPCVLIGGATPEVLARLAVRAPSLAGVVTLLRPDGG